MWGDQSAPRVLGLPGTAHPTASPASVPAVPCLQEAGRTVASPSGAPRAAQPPTPRRHPEASFPGLPSSPEPRDPACQGHECHSRREAGCGPSPPRFLAARPQAPLAAPLSLGFCMAKGETRTRTPGPGPGLPAALSVRHLARRPARGKVEALGSRPLLWAPLWALLWVCLPRPLPSTRQRLDAICLGPREPGGLRLEANASGLTQRPPPPPALSPKLLTRLRQGMCRRCCRDGTALLARWGCPRSETPDPDTDHAGAGQGGRSTGGGLRGRGA